MNRCYLAIAVQLSDFISGNNIQIGTIPNKRQTAKNGITLVKCVKCDVIGSLRLNLFSITEKTN